MTRWSDIDTREFYINEDHGYAIRVIDYLEDTIQKIRNIHYEWFGECAECHTASGLPVSYPCKTVRELNRN